LEDITRIVVDGPKSMLIIRCTLHSIKHRNRLTGFAMVFSVVKRHLQCTEICFDECDCKQKWQLSDSFERSYALHMISVYRSG